MAVVTAYEGVDLSSTVLHQYGLNAFEEGYSLDGPFELEGVSYDNFYVLRAMVGGEDRVVVLLGSGFVFDEIDQIFTAGVVEAWIEARWDGDDIYAVQGVSMSLVETLDTMLFAGSMVSQASVDQQFAGDDVFWLSDEGDTVDGGGGNDTLWGGLGKDSLIGGDGDDVFHLSGPDVISKYDLAEMDRISGGAGHDVVHGDAGLMVYLEDGVEVVNGSIEADFIWGGSFEEPALLFGNEGNDTLRGEGRMEGGTGDDSLIADGPSTLIGGAGYDQLEGSTGDDVFYWEGGDWIVPNGGYDTLVIASQTGITLYLDTLQIDRIVGGAGDDEIGGGFYTITRIEAGAGDDTIYASDIGVEYFGENGSDEIHGAAGNDLLVGDDAPDLIFNDPEFAFLLA